MQSGWLGLGAIINFCDQRTKYFSIINELGCKWKLFYYENKRLIIEICVIVNNNKIFS